MMDDAELEALDRGEAVEEAVEEAADGAFVVPAPLIPNPQW